MSEIQDMSEIHNNTDFTNIFEKTNSNKKLFTYLMENNDFHNIILNYLKDKEYIYKVGNKYKLKEDISKLLDCNSNKEYYELDILKIIKKKKIKCDDFDSDSSKEDDIINEEIDIKNIKTEKKELKNKLTQYVNPIQYDCNNKKITDINANSYIFNNDIDDIDGYYSDTDINKDIIKYKKKNNLKNNNLENQQLWKLLISVDQKTKLLERTLYLNKYQHLKNNENKFFQFITVGTLTFLNVIMLALRF
jgi:hypothetical protein